MMNWIRGSALDVVKVIVSYTQRLMTPMTIPIAGSKSTTKDRSERQEQKLLDQSIFWWWTPQCVQEPHSFSDSDQDLVPGGSR